MNNLGSNYRKLRILQVHWTFPPTTGGVESHIVELARMLVEEGHDVTVLTGEKDPLPCEGVDVISTPMLDLMDVKGREVHDTEINTFRSKLDIIVGEKRINVIHGHDFHHFSPI